MWQWWDGRTWKALEPGDEGAGNKAYNRKAANLVLLGAGALALVGMIWASASNAMGI